MAEKKFLVTTCDGSRRFTEFKAAAKYARSKSAKRHEIGGCSGANVWHEWKGYTGPRGSMLLRCKNKVCTPTANLRARQQDMMRGAHRRR